MNTGIILPKSGIFSKIVHFFVIEPLKKCGFVHRSPFIKGPPENVVFTNDIRQGLANTVFNTLGGKIYIGKNVVFGHDCLVLTPRYDYLHFDERYLCVDKTKKNDVHIEDYVWVASGVIILSGVKIGKHSVIASGSVVVDDIPEYSFAVGVPARVKRKIELVDEV